MALEVNGLAKSYESALFDNLDLTVEVGERIAVIGPNGIGKSTLMQCLVGVLEPTAGLIKWSENANVAYYAQDHAADFKEDLDLVAWMNRWGREGDDEQIIRGTLGRLLFSSVDINKSVNVISGGEQGRMLFGKMMLQRPNILVMDEPTNHLDMESIESLNLALDNYLGTLVFVSHDREFVSSLATRIIELTPKGIVDYHGTYDEYLASQAIVG
ncbi:MAG: ATPase subunit of ABC transporter with duplicated ATPase domains [Reinekea sp.]|jgi:ATPase subunit of ABC transporter with duplicated ATPase domains